MEHDTAGLELVGKLRAACGQALQLILTTGQPHIAAPEAVAAAFEISHYLAKPDATPERLRTILNVAIRHFRAQMAMQLTRDSLRGLVDMFHSATDPAVLDEMLRGALEQYAVVWQMAYACFPDLASTEGIDDMAAWVRQVREKLLHLQVPEGEVRAPEPWAFGAFQAWGCVMKSPHGAFRGAALLATQQVPDTLQAEFRDLLYIWGTTKDSLEDQVAERTEQQQREARYVEELRAARDAAEEQSISLALANGELSRLLDFRSGLLERLGQPEHGLVPRLGRRSSELLQVKGLPQQVQSVAKEMADLANQISTQLTLHDFYSSAQSAGKGRRVLVVQSDKKLRKLISRALLGTGAVVQSVDTSEQGLEILSDAHDLLLVDWNSAGMAAAAVKKAPKLQVVLTTTQSLFEEVGRGLVEMPVSGVLIRNIFGTSDSGDPSAIQELVITAGKLLTGDVFGVEKYLSWGSMVREEAVTHSRDRERIIELVGEYASACGLRPNVRTAAQTLTDELLMNAIWDAPVDANGKPKYAHLSRTEPVALLPNERVAVRYGNDANVFAVSVVDQFGRLDSDLAFRYLKKCFAKGEDQIDQKQGGAGLGLYFAFLATNTFVFNVSPQKRTEAIGLIRMNNAPGENPVRSFHYFRGME
ncbi:MAG TPA: hypothetical protein VND93_01770 [Myxococcales bacterium]|nr:hypothetical protein [Myxococcales bacterium]